MITIEARILSAVPGCDALVFAALEREMREAVAEATTSLESENTRLRAALAVSKDHCVYCKLPADQMSKCQDIRDKIRARGKVEINEPPELEQGEPEISFTEFKAKGLIKHHVREDGSTEFFGVCWP
jgi:methylmalonyl-CoA mutase cobalamin-binding subunit